MVVMPWFLTAPFYLRQCNQYNQAFSRLLACDGRLLYIKALASARGSEKRKNQKNCARPIYVFVDSEQKAEFKAKIKPCSHQLNCMKFLL